MPNNRYYQEQYPSSNLPFVLVGIEKVWSSPSDKSEEHLILPDGRSDFILKFSLDENGKPTSIIPIIAGPSTSWLISYSRPNQGFVGIRFKPGRGGRFFGIPLNNIAGRSYSGNEALALAPKFHELCKPAYDINTLIRKLEAFFILHHDETLPASLEAVINDIHHSGGCTPINVLAKKNGITTRTLARTFLKTVGISPKVFAAIIRFHHTLKLLTRGRTIKEASAEAGYADQAHMTRDFRRFGGFTPGNIPNDLTLIELPFS